MVQKKLKKTKVAFIISPNQNWLGEINYFKSLIGSINNLDEPIPIEVYVFTSEFEKNLVQKKYKKIKFIKTSFLNESGFLSFIKKILGKLFGRYDPVISFLLKKNSIDVLSHYKPIKGFKNISWFPDFQHVHYPLFFSKKEILLRNKLYNNYIKNSEILIVSSESSKKDLIKFKKEDKKIEILKFLPEINFSKIEDKKVFEKKLNIRNNYIFTPNQFWVHKNHICIIEALNILKKKGIKIKCILTGSQYDHRDNNHFGKLMKKIELYQLKNQIKYMGVLPYNKIINLLYHATIIINPSLFEGWSTVVEEAKILDKRILLSNINVHIEQKPKKGIFFNPNDPKYLAQKIERIFNLKEPRKKKISTLIDDYIFNRKVFAKKYINIVQKLKV
jgi:glycosyltransferase involved in cell wall biosynthesis